MKNVNIKNTVAAIAVTALVILLSAGSGSANWVSEIVDSNGTVGQFTAMDLSSTGEPNISYYDETSDTLKYAFKDTAGWHKEMVESGVQSIGSSSDIVVDPAGRPHIVYYDSYNNNPKYAVKNGSTWTVENIDNTGTLGGQYPSIDLDSAGNPHVCFCDGPYALYYGYNTGTGWNTELVQGEMSGGYYDSNIKLDSNDNPHVIYTHLAYNGGTIRYGVRTAGTWDLQDAVVQIGEYGGTMDLDLYANMPHISYYNSADMTINYAYLDTSWHTETIAVNEDWYGYTAIVMDPGGNPHISYYFEAIDGDGDLRYAHKTTSGWATQIVDNSSTYTGVYSSIDLDSDNNPHISYYDYSEADLKYAYFDPSVCPTTGVTVTMPSHVFHSGDPCSCTAIVCNADGFSLEGYPLVVILAVGNLYFFAPSYDTYWDDYGNEYPVFSIGQTEVTIIEEFSWPVVGGSFSGVLWYAALLTPELDALHGELGTFMFGWE